MSHTQGRLATNGDTISDSGGEPIAYLEWSGHHEEDARRLVACWNACEDLPQDALDGGWTAAGISQYAKRLEGERDALKAENERLRKDTVKAVFAMIDPLNPPGAPGSYARGEHNGIVAAGRTLKDAIGVAMRETK